MLLALVGMLWLSQISAGADYLTQMAMPMVLLGIGMGSAFTPLTTAGMAGVADRDAGAASGLVNVAQQLGGTLGDRRPGHGLRRGQQRRRRPTPWPKACRRCSTGSAILIALALIVVLAVMRPQGEPAVGIAEPEAAA